MRARPAPSTRPRRSAWSGCSSELEPPGAEPLPGAGRPDRAARRHPAGRAGRLGVLDRTSAISWAASSPRWISTAERRAAAVPGRGGAAAAAALGPRLLRRRAGGGAGRGRDGRALRHRRVRRRGAAAGGSARARRARPTLLYRRGSRPRGASSATAANEAALLALAAEHGVPAAAVGTVGVPDGELVDRDTGRPVRLADANSCGRSTFSHPAADESCGRGSRRLTAVGSGDRFAGGAGACAAVFGVSGVPDAARLTYLGLYALQHRGQESAGIVAVDEHGRARAHRGMGLVSENFNEAVALQAAGRRGRRPHPLLAPPAARCSPTPSRCSSDYRGTARSPSPTTAT